MQYMQESVFGCAKLACIPYSRVLDDPASDEGRRYLLHQGLKT